MARSVSEGARAPRWEDSRDAGVAGGSSRLGLKILFSVGLTLALLECGSALVIHAGIVPSSVPPYKLPPKQVAFNVDSDPAFGAWHVPNQLREHRRACFRVTYRTNSYGALDAERPRRSNTPRVVVLGDSFAVGHGVATPQRFSNRLEALTGIPHLNFAVGGTGPTHAYLVYKHKARAFDHDRVLLSILPANDFFDDMPRDKRYRPYWAGTYPAYTLRFVLPRLEDSAWHPSHHESRFTYHDILGTYSYVYNALDWLYGAYRLMRSRQADADYSGYYDFREEEFLRLRYSLEQLHALVPGGRLSVMVIPRWMDFRRHDEQNGKNPLGQRLAALAQQVGFELIDMLPRMAKALPRDLFKLYLGCDGHWSALGHEFAAKTLERELYRPQQSGVGDEHPGHLGLLSR